MLVFAVYICWPRHSLPDEQPRLSMRVSTKLGEESFDKTWYWIVSESMKISYSSLST